MQPELSRGYQFGLFVREAAHCRNPGTYVAGLVDYAKFKGLRRIETRALGFTQACSRLTCVQTLQGTVAYGAAVISAGARSRPLATLRETECGWKASVDTMSPSKATCPVQRC